MGIPSHRFEGADAFFRHWSALTGED